MDVAHLLSGGVDSSVALAKLVRSGIKPQPFYLKVWTEDDTLQAECPWKTDVEFADKVCKQLGLKLEILPMQREYFDRVVAYTLSEIRAGRTPNPDIMCNTMIKFGAFSERMGPEFDKIATGHYARLKQMPDGWALMTSPDPIKDQTYFLSALKRDQLAKALFPIGDMTKSEVRQAAIELNLPNATRPDSQGLCFLGKLRFRDFLEHYLGRKNGKLVDFDTGNVVGEHDGYWFYTIGQRQGIGLPGGPWYVVKKVIDANVVFVSRNYYAADKPRKQFEVGEFNWLYNLDPSTVANLRIKIRHGERFYDAKFEFLDASKERGKVVLSESDQGIAAGQFAVFYVNEICLGSARIAGDL